MGPGRLHALLCDERRELRFHAPARETRLLFLRGLAAAPPLGLVQSTDGQRQPAPDADERARAESEERQHLPAAHDGSVGCST
jgi:hypothetical protein